MGTLTVKDLIAFLQTCPQDAEVYTFSEDTDKWIPIPKGEPEYYSEFIETNYRLYNAVLLN